MSIRRPSNIYVIKIMTLNNISKILKIIKKIMQVFKIFIHGYWIKIHVLTISLLISASNVHYYIQAVLRKFFLVTRKERFC